MDPIVAAAAAIDTAFTSVRMRWGGKRLKSRKEYLYLE